MTTCTMMTCQAVTCPMLACQMLACQMMTCHQQKPITVYHMHQIRAKFGLVSCANGLPTTLALNEKAKRKDKKSIHALLDRHNIALDPFFTV